MDTSIKSSSLPILGDSNFEAWRQSLSLVACALSVEVHLDKEIDPTSLKGEDRRNFYTFANLMLSSLSERPRAIAVGPGTPSDLVPFRMLDRLKKFFMPIMSFNDLTYRRELFSLRFENFGSIDLFAASIQRISSKITEIEMGKVNKYGIKPSVPSERDLITILVGTLPPDFDPEIKEIEKDHKLTFSDALEELRSREVKMRSDRPNPPSDSLNSIEIICNHCQRRGHSIDRCYLKHPELRGGRGSANSNGHGRGRGNNRGNANRRGKQQ